MMTKVDFAEEFEKLRRELNSFILRIVTNVEDTKDIVQDTYLKSSAHLSSFKGKSSLKTWIFAIASNLAKDHLRGRKRWPENVTDISREATLQNRDFLDEMIHIRTTSPHGAFEIKEHIAFCFTCVSKSLPLDQQVALLLKEVSEFKISEIAEIMNSSEGVVKHLLHDGRNKMTEIYDHRCSLINKNGICHQCSELNGIFNPKQKFQEELMKIEMTQNSDNKSREELFDLRMKIVKGIDPFESGASELELRHLRQNHELMESR